MTFITERNFKEKLPQAVRDRFWLEVETALIKLGASPQLSKAYREDIEQKLSFGEQILVYHYDPSKLATDLAGIPEKDDDASQTGKLLVRSSTHALVTAPGTHLSRVAAIVVPYSTYERVIRPLIAD